MGRTHGRLGRDPLTVVDEEQRPLLVLGWRPGTGCMIGEGVAWQADGIHSNTIFGRPLERDPQAPTISGNRLLQGSFGPAWRYEPLNRGPTRAVPTN